MGLGSSTFVNENNIIKACGYNAQGQLGLGDKIDRRTLTEIDGLIDVVQIASEFHTVALKKDGTIMVCGNNGSGQLGLGDITSRTEFIPVTGLPEIQQVACSWNTTMLLTVDGEVYVAGDNDYGQLGLGESEYRKKFNTFIKVPNITDIKHISCSSTHSVIVTNSGTVKSAGYNGDGQLGTGPNPSYYDKIKYIFTDVVDITDVVMSSCSYDYTIILLSDGSIKVSGTCRNGAFGDYTSTDLFIDIEGISNAKYISTGSRFTIILMDDGTVKVSGYNSAGQLGLGDKKDRYGFVSVPDVSDCTMIDTSSSNNILHLENGNVKITGDNYYGQLGNDSSVGSEHYIDLVNKDNVELMTDELVLDTEVDIVLPPVKEIPFIKQILFGIDSTYILMKNGSLQVTGANQMGQIGMGEKDKYMVRTKFTPVRDIIGVKKMFNNPNGRVIYLLMENGDVLVSGYNGCHQTGMDESVFFTYNFIKMQDVSNVIDIYVAIDFTCMLLSNGTVMVAGKNNYGQLGFGDKVAVKRFTLVPNAINIKKVAFNAYGVIVMVTNDGKLKVCGNNTNGQLGLGSNTEQLSFIDVPGISNVSDAVCNQGTIHIIKNDGTVMGSGYNGSGEIGNGDNVSTNVFVNTVGLTLPVKKLIAATDSRTIALLENNTLMATGSNIYGQLGMEHVIGVQQFTQINISNVRDVTCGYCNMIITLLNGDVLGTGIGSAYQMGGDVGSVTRYTVPTKIKTLSNIDLFETGQNYSLAVSGLNMTLKGSGYSINGQLGVGTNLTEFTDIKYDNPYEPVDISIDAELELKPLDLENMVPMYKQIVFNKSATYFLTKAGKLKTTGLNTKGQLGLGDVNTRFKITPVPDIENISKLFTNMNTDLIFLLMNDGSLMVAGDNVNFNTGLGKDVTVSTIFTRVPNIDNVKEVIVSGTVTIAILNNGDVYGVGKNEIGQLGFGNNDIVYGFKLIPNASNIKKVAIGNYGSILMATNDGKLKVCGKNNFSQLGLNNFVDLKVVTENTSITDVKDVYCNNNATFVLLNDGSIRGCGCNDNFELGTGDRTSYKTFIKPIDLVLPVKEIRTVNERTILLLENGRVLGSGRNNYGELGEVTGSSKFIDLGIDGYSKILIGMYTMVVLFKNGEVYGCGLNAEYKMGNRNSSYIRKLTKLTALSNIIQLCETDSRCTIVEGAGGVIKGSGYSVDGRLGINYNTVDYTILKHDNPLEPLNSNLLSELVFRSDNNLNIKDAELYTVNTKNPIKKVCAGASDTFLLLSDGTLMATGNNDKYVYGDGTCYPTTIHYLLTKIRKDVKDIFTYYSYTFIITKDDKLMGAGRTDRGGLGLGINSDYVKYFTEIPNISKKIKHIESGDMSGHTMILLEDGTIMGCGSNSWNELGIDTDKVSVGEFTLIPGISNVKQIAITGSSSMILLNDGTIMGCGLNTMYGQLGFGDLVNRTVFTLVPNISGVKKIVSSRYDSYGLLMEDGTVKVCGNNSNGGAYGSLGVPSQNRYITTFTDTGLTNVKNIHMGYGNVICMFEDNTVKVCGYNHQGQLGLGYDSLTVTSYTDHKFLSSFPNLKMSGSGNTLVAYNDTMLMVVGANNANQLGLGSSPDVYHKNINEYRSVKYIKELIFDKSNLDCEVNFKPAPVTIKDIGVHKSVVMLLSDGKIKVLGKNDQGQLGLGTNVNVSVATDVPGIDNVKKFSISNTFIYLLLNDGSVMVSGTALNGQFGNATDARYTTFTKLTNISGVKDISVTDYNAVLVMNDGTVQVSGLNQRGMLGTGGTENTLRKFTVVPNISNADNVYILSGNGGTILVMNDGSIKVAGYNANGQLGLGTTSTSVQTFTNIPNINRADIKHISSSKGSIVITMNDGTVKACGMNYYGELGLPTTNVLTLTTIPNISGVKKAESGGCSTVLLMDDGTIMTAGSNDQSGELGLGDYVNRREFTPVTYLSGVKEIFGGFNNNLVLMDDNVTVKISGNNRFYQLGNTGPYYNNKFGDIETGLENKTDVECILNADVEYSNILNSELDCELIYMVKDANVNINAEAIYMSTNNTKSIESELIYMIKDEELYINSEVVYMVKDAKAHIDANVTYRIDNNISDINSEVVYLSTNNTKSVDSEVIMVRRNNVQVDAECMFTKHLRATIIVY